MYKIFKRIVDVIVSFIALLILSPLLIPVIIGLKLTGEGYIFYKQERLGFKNKKFGVLKFATMLKNSPNMGSGLITTNKDPRITPMGGFLRKSKINELPQIINVFLGDMSFVGPRPVMQKSFDQYPADIQKIIYNVVPGITGVGSLIFRDEEDLITKVQKEGGDVWDFYRHAIYPYKGLLEKWYQANQSFIVDLKILFLTAWAILYPKTELAFEWFNGLPEKPDSLDLH